MKKTELRTRVARLEAENRELKDRYNADVTAGRDYYLHALHLLVPYMEAELDHLRRENAELKTQIEGEEHD